MSDQAVTSGTPTPEPPHTEVTPHKVPLLNAIDVEAGYFPGVNILNGMTLHAQEGELVGIIGPNGAGKSTFLKAVFGLVGVRSGTMALNGHDITGLRADELVRRGVGFVPQTNNVFPSLTIEENLQMGVYQEPKKFPERFEMVTTLFPMLGERRKQRAGSLSGGERQMVAMSRALMMSPSLLLLDEPSMGLAPKLVQDIYRVVAEINATGTTILLVEQNANLALRLAHRAGVLETGQLTLQGPSAEVLANPKVREAYLGA